LTVGIKMPTKIVKRSGETVDFDTSKIHVALQKCFSAVPHSSDVTVDQLVRRICSTAFAKYSVNKVAIPTVENIQDIVEMVLQSEGEFEAAKHYILFRAERTRLRNERPITTEVRAAFDADKKYFPTAIQSFQFYDKYSRFNYDLGRRETWVETVDRAVTFLHKLTGPKIDRETYEEIRMAILEHKIMPSMRLLAMAGKPAERDNTTIYNCSYLPVDSLESFVEALFISMAGCGVGFSVEEVEVQKLPQIKLQIENKYPVNHIVDDSAEGWGVALRVGLHAWFNGEDVLYNFSNIRPAGSVLLTKGGRASGPEPLQKLLAFAKNRILARQGKRLRTIDAHDIMCAVGSAAVAGGVRRTAMISLFDEDDELMLNSKAGDFAQHNSQRWNANNSVVWSGSDPVAFMKQFTTMVEGERGEPGIFSRENAIRLAPGRRNFEGMSPGTNPCGEIVLRPRQFCNLSAVINRAGDTYDTLSEKVRLATIVGTIQSTATYFPNLSGVWQRNCEDERLLGVDITGQLDNSGILVSSFKNLAAVARAVNFDTAKKLGINQSAAITTVKPSGNTSVFVDCSSGLHARWAPYYIKNARVSIDSPIYKVLRDANVPMAPENGGDNRTMVVLFPIKSPDGAITRNDRTAIEQCEWWLLNKTEWTEHNPSVTITYKPHEVIDLQHWLWNHRDKIGGMAFLPSFDAKYDQLPYIEITQEEYERRASEFPVIDWSKIFQYEYDDQTKAAQELACVSGVCSVDEIQI